MKGGTTMSNMTLADFKAKFAEIKTSIEELRGKCYHDLWKGATDKHTQHLADYLYDELDALADKFGELMELEENEYVDTDMDIIEDWWSEADNERKAYVMNVPPPVDYSGRGDDILDFEDKADKWWNAKTDAQKIDIYDRFAEDW